MRERVIESYLTRQTRSAGGLSLKWTSPGMTGVPDRILIFPGGRIAFVELKAPRKTERPRQVYVQGLLRRLGCTVYGSIDSREKVDRIIQEMTGTHNSHEKGGVAL